MGNEAKVVTYKKKSGILTAIAVIAALAAAGFVAYKVYKKYFAKKKVDEIPAEEEVAVLEAEDVAAEDAVEEEVFEAPAEAVIANAEEI